MSYSVNTAKSQKLADALCSIKAVRKYQLNRQANGAERVRLYVDDVDGDWLNDFDEKETRKKIITCLRIYVKVRCYLQEFKHLLTLPVSAELG